MTADHMHVAAEGAVLIYDGDCGFCATAASWASRRFRHEERTEAWQFLSEEFLFRHRLQVEEVRQAAWWVDGSGLHERGHRAIGRALQAGGGLRWVAGWFVLHGPTSWLAAGSYWLVVRWRHRLPGGTPACKFPGTE